MQSIKLQLGCFLVILFIEITYLRESRREHFSYNRQFELLMLTAPFAVFFDRLTAWTVNHLDIVPGYLNRLAHLFFFIWMDLTIIITSEYMYDQLIGFHKASKKDRLLLELPGAVSLLLIIAGIGELDYIQGVTTWYSMGFSVYVCYGTVVLYYGTILFLVFTRHRFLPKEKVISTLSFILIAGVILAVQIRFPEVLLTSIFPMVLLLVIYLDFENPFIRKLTLHNEEMLDGFATMIESRDNNTGGHIKRTRAYVNLILEKMKKDKHYQDILNRDYMINVSNAAPLHDIGKIATPDNILQKPGKLTDEEYRIMKEHAATGGDIILHTFYNLDDKEFRQIAYEVARFHHEKYNGNGYPDGLVGEQIPLHARIMAIADVFDAVSQKRCYREAMSLDESFSIIKNGIGTDFDPRLAELFLNAREEVEELMKQIKYKKN
ncbi:HD-GYP domain-containing protein [Blautia sp. HCP3S3_H10_1]|uniref:HD-GYP domain-containing protein n=1 Tax=unclassified Blautia TaxID=2648079 RepID=UPI003F8EAF02|nr:HD domain-containing protein [Clostridia bacterium]